MWHSFLASLYYSWACFSARSIGHASAKTDVHEVLVTNAKAQQVYCMSDRELCWFATGLVVPSVSPGRARILLGALSRIEFHKVKRWEPCRASSVQNIGPRMQWCSEQLSRHFRVQHPPAIAESILFWNLLVDLLQLCFDDLQDSSTGQTQQQWHKIAPKWGVAEKHMQTR